LQSLSGYLASQSQAVAASSAQGQTSNSNKLTPAQVEILSQYLANAGQMPDATQATAVQAQALLQGAQNQAGAPAVSAVGPKKPGIIRIGVTEPKAQMGQGNSGANVAEPIRAMVAQYLNGPALEILPLSAMLPSQIDAEAKVKDCDFVVYSGISQKMSSGGLGMLKKVAPMASMIPMVGMAGGMTGAMAGAMAGSAVSGMAGVASTVKARSEITFEYRLMASGNASPVLANAIKVKAKEDGEDVISPLVEQAATDILAQVTKAKK
jgi:hypothetical protein